jgi:hypothetical protein
MGTAALARRSRGTSPCVASRVKASTALTAQIRQIPVLRLSYGTQLFGHGASTLGAAGTPVPASSAAGNWRVVESSALGSTPS